MSLTIALLSCWIVFSRDDLPAFVGPIMATATPSLIALPVLNVSRRFSISDIICFVVSSRVVRSAY